MKKILLFILCLMLFPVVVNGKEYCKITKGNGNTIGDEFQCGTESFYLVSNQNGIKELLAKYNLFVGDIINYVETDKDLSDFGVSYNLDYDAMEDYCFSIAENAGYHPYAVYYILDDYHGNPTEFLGCRVYERIEYDRVLQDSRAVGTKLDGNGRSILPLYGITYMNPEWGYHATGNVYGNDYDDQGNLLLEGTEFNTYLDGYKEELVRQNIDVESVSFITLDKTLQLLKDISGRDIVVDLVYENDYDDWDPNFFTGKMDIKNYVGNHKWIYDITYWLGSGFKSYYDQNLFYNDYFISNEGMLCAIGRGECMYLPYPIGNGIRPLVRIPSESIAYSIRTKTDGNGTIEVIDLAQGNESIVFKVTSKKGYKLSQLLITTDSGERVEFNEGDIINNLDGTVSISNNAFTMPFESVTIEARWATNPINPSTGVRYSILVISLIVIVGISLFFSKKNTCSEK